MREAGTLRSILKALASNARENDPQVGRRSREQEKVVGKGEKGAASVVHHPARRKIGLGVSSPSGRGELEGTCVFRRLVGYATA
jgi:hypothetical protein